MDNYIYILFITELLFLAISYILTRGNLLSPSLLSYAMFALATICIIYNVDYWEVRYSEKAYWITTAGFFSMLLPELLFIKKIGTATQKDDDNSMNGAIHIDLFVNICVSIVVVIATIIYAYIVIERGKSLGGVGLNAIGYAKHDLTGSATVLERAIYRLLMLLFYVYTYFFIRNIFGAKKKIKSQIINVIPIICFFVTSFFNGNRLGLLKCLLAIYVCVLAMIYQATVFDKKNVKKVLGYVFISGSLMVIAFYFLRVITKVNTSTAGRNFIDYITYYIGSPVYLFSKYLEEPHFVHPENTLFGETTFSALLSELGFEPQFNNNVLYVGGNSYFAGNACSWFQEPYNDYGFCGMLIFTAIVYLIFDAIIYRGIIKNKSKYAVFFLMFFEYVIVMSFYYCQTMWAVSITNGIYLLLIIFIANMLPKIKIKR